MRPLMPMAVLTCSGTPLNQAWALGGNQEQCRSTQDECSSSTFTLTGRKKLIARHAEVRSRSLRASAFPQPTYVR